MTASLASFHWFAPESRPRGPGRVGRPRRALPAIENHTPADASGITRRPAFQVDKPGTFSGVDRGLAARPRCKVEFVYPDSELRTLEGLPCVRKRPPASRPADCCSRRNGAVSRLPSGSAPGIGGVAAVLLRGSDEYVAHAKLRPAKRGREGAALARSAQRRSTGAVLAPECATLTPGGRLPCRPRRAGLWEDLG